MRILVLANTPAHVHLYRNAVDRLERAGHDVLVLTREYACTTDLLEYFGLPYRVYGEHDTSGYSKLRFARELGGQFRSIATETLRFGPDVVFGRGPYAAFAGTLSRTPVVLVLDDEPGDFNHAVSRPFADCILSPAVTRRDLGDDHYTFDGFKECAYLHPAVFEPNADVRESLGVGSDEPYVLVRFNALDALHDAGLEGFRPEQRRDLIERLSEAATVLVSDEGDDVDLGSLPAREYDHHPARIHDAMSEAALLVADTGTMATEAALLGTPALRYRGTDDHEYGEFRELERAGLAEQFDAYDAVRDRALELLGDPGTADRWARRRREYVGDLVNLTDLLVDVAASRGAVDRLEGATERALRPPSRST
jgi:predicted glycosyltransferase